MTIIERHEFTDPQWDRILSFIPAPKGLHEGYIFQALQEPDLEEVMIQLWLR